MEYLFTDFVHELEIHILPLAEHLSSFGVVKEDSRHTTGKDDMSYRRLNFYLLPPGEQGRAFSSKCLTTENVKLLEYKETFSL